jgi:F0F1-type ATP synthase alpha subunit
MKQPQYSPLTNAEIVCVIFAGTNGLSRQARREGRRRFEQGLLSTCAKAVGHARLDHQRTTQDQGRAPTR